MNVVKSKFGENNARGPKFVFGDNYADKYRKSGVKRKAFGGQSKVMGHYDRDFGFGVPTTFAKAKAFGFIYNTHNFQCLMKQLFGELKNHISSGGDVVIPVPTNKDLKRAPTKYKKGDEQFVFHNLGTGNSLLQIDELILVQEFIEDLKALSSQSINCKQAYM
eukprot:UN01358